MPDPRELPQDRWRFVPPLVLGLLPFVFFLPIALVRRVFSAHDVQAYFFPYHVLPAKMLADGDLPLWNPYVFGGIPLLGDGQTAMFFPPNWLFFLLPGPVALNYVVLLQFSLAGVGTYLFARALGLRRLPAFVAGLSYMFCGFLTARVVHLSIMAGAAMIPLIFFCLDRLLLSIGPASPSSSARHRPARWLACTALVVCSQAVAGHPQIPVYTALAVTLYAFVRGIEGAIARRSWRPVAGGLLLLAGAYGLGYALAAIQLIPWAELARLSVRAAGADYDFVFSTSTTGAEWLLFLFPYLFGAHEGSLFAPGAWDIQTAVRTWEHSGYVGLLPLALALVALWHLIELTMKSKAGAPISVAAPTATARAAVRPTPASTPATMPTLTSTSTSTPTSRPMPATEAFGEEWSWTLRRRWYSLLFLALLLAAGLILAAGWHTPFSGLIYRTPVLGSLRAVERGLVLACFSLTLLAGFGLQRIAERPRPQAQRRPQPRLSWLLLPAALLVIVPAWFVWHAHQPGASRLLGIDPQDLQRLSTSGPQVYVPLLLALAGGLWLAWCGWRPAGRLTLGVAALLVLIDLGLYATAFNPTANRALYLYRPQVTTALRGDGELFRKATVLVHTNDLLDRSAQEDLTMSWGMVHGVEDINGFNSLQPRRYTDYVFGPQANDVSYGYLRDLSLLRADSPILSSLNVRYVLVPAGVEIEPGPHLRPVFENRSVRVFENDRAYPRAYFTERVRTDTDPRSVLRQVTAPGFDGRRDALVETAAPPQVSSSPAATAPPAIARAARQSPSELRVTTTTTEPRFLVVSEMYFPGWRAYVDDVETPIYRTNYLFQGVAVPEGQHVVRLVYRPSSVVTGASVSSLALLAIGVLFTRGSRRRA